MTAWFKKESTFYEDFSKEEALVLIRAFEDGCVYDHHDNVSWIVLEEEFKYLFMKKYEEILKELTLNGWEFKCHYYGHGDIRLFDNGCTAIIGKSSFEGRYYDPETKSWPEIQS